MNLLKHHVKKVHSVEPYAADWTKKHGIHFVVVKLTSLCYGARESKTRIFDVDEWERIKTQGYYMA